MSLLLSSIGGVVGGLFGQVGSGIQYGLNKGLINYQAKKNYEYAEKSARNVPTWNRAGLEAAGYNPMLAVQNGTSGANASWSSGSSVSNPDLSSAISTGVANAQSFQRLSNETKQADAIARNQNAEAANKELENPFIPEKQRREISNIKSQTDYNNALIDNLSARLELDRVLGFAGLDVQRRGQDMVYNASKYASDISSQNMIRSLNTGTHSFNLGRFYNYTRRNSR